jgi:LysM repeat protein
MDNNDSNLKPQQTGGLKLMTVFIGVLALHVIVIGGMTVYYALKGGSADADLVTDKVHKDVKVTPEGTVAGDAPSPDAISGDKNTTAAAALATTPDTTSPAASPTEIASTSAPATIPAPAVPATASPAPDETASIPSGPVQSGPVITPPAAMSPATTSPATDIAAEPAVTPDANMDAIGGTPYVVKTHDSLARIAHQHHISVAKLKEANSLTGNMLHIGQKLTIPAKTVVASTAAAADPNTEATPMTEAAPASAPAARIKAKPSGPDRTLLGDSIPRASTASIASTSHDEASVNTPATSSRHTYTVMKGDTLTRIAHKLHTTMTAIMAANGSLDARKLRIGQKLRIPSQEPRSANVTPTPVQQQQQEAQPDRIEPRASTSAQLANFIP